MKAATIKWYQVRVMTLDTLVTLFFFSATTTGEPWTPPITSPMTNPSTSASTVAQTLPPVQSTTEEAVEHWFQKTEGIITISVFATAFVAVIVGGVAYLYWYSHR